MPSILFLFNVQLGYVKIRNSIKMEQLTTIPNQQNQTNSDIPNDGFVCSGAYFSLHVVNVRSVVLSKMYSQFHKFTNPDTHLHSNLFPRHYLMLLPVIVDTGTAHGLDFRLTMIQSNHHTKTPRTKIRPQVRTREKKQKHVRMKAHTLRSPFVNSAAGLNNATTPRCDDRLEALDFDKVLVFRCANPTAVVVSECPFRPRVVY